MEILNENNKDYWEDFEKKNENIPPQHLLNWKRALEKSYKNCSGKYYFNRGEMGEGPIFPFLIVKSKLLGNRAISQPFLDFGGPLGKPDEGFFSEVLEELKKIPEIDKIEIRLNNFNEHYDEMEKTFIKLGFKKEFKKNQLILKLKSEDDLWNDFNRITKKGIKKAEKSSLKLKDLDNEEELKAFYNLYMRNMRNFGTPQHSYGFFKNLSNLFKEGFKGINCYKEEKLIASLLVLYGKDYMYAAYNVSEPKFLIYQPNDLIHWEMIRWGIKKGIKYFDIGQCDSNAEQGTHAAGIYRFKSKWGARIYDKYYFHYKIREDLKTERPKGRSEYEKVIKIWKKLPLPIIKKIGPRIASQLAL